MNPPKEIRTKVNRLLILFVIFLGLFEFILVSWLRSPPPKARWLAPLLAEIDHLKVTTGQYPTNYLTFASYSNLAKQFTIYPGGRDTNGVIWETAEVSGHDFTVLVDQDGYEVFLPVGRMKLISFSSFPVWRYDSSQQHWKKGRIHWSYGGSYWSKD